MPRGVKLGLLTASLGGMSAEAVLARAGALGLDAVELAAWPPALERPFTAAHVGAAPTAGQPAQLRSWLERHELRLAALAYYDNPLDPDPARRSRMHAHLDTVIDWAAELECPLVGTFIGRHPGRTVAENLQDAERLFPRYVARAGERGVRLMVENCPMRGWHPDHYPANLAYSPELWEWLAQLGLWLCFDPSHLPPLGIDPLAALESQLDRVVHVHAKDVVTSSSGRSRFSCYGPVLGRDDPWEAGWWAYRLPGEGDVEWPALLGALSADGFDGVVAIEHEEEQGLGTPERILAGVEQAGRFLRGQMDRRDRVGVVEGRIRGER